MSFQLTKDEILMQLSQALREDNDLIEELYQQKFGGTVYYVGDDTFVVEDDDDDEEIEGNPWDALKSFDW